MIAQKIDRYVFMRYRLYIFKWNSISQSNLSYNGTYVNTSKLVVACKFAICNRTAIHVEGVAESKGSSLLFFSFYCDFIKFNFAFGLEAVGGLTITVRAFRLLLPYLTFIFYSIFLSKADDICGRSIIWRCADSRHSWRAVEDDFR